MTTLYLIRHGETVWNADGRFQGHQDTALNDAGRAQARLLADRLASTHFDAIYTSDLGRAADTANIIAASHYLTPIPDTRLREAYFGEWEGLTIQEITERWSDIVAAWRRDSLHTRPPGGETLEQLQERVANFIEAAIQLHPDGQILIAGHGGSIRAAIATALGATLTIFNRLRLDNCSLSVVRHQSDRFSLVQMNDTCHLHGVPLRTTWDESGDQLRMAMEPRHS